MNITYAPNDILQIDDAKIIFRNFSGDPGKYNREGDRNFAVVIPTDEMADEFTARGWNVVVKPPREEGEEPFRYLKVKMKFNDYGPVVYLRTGNAQNKLSEDAVGILDNIDILTVGLDIRPYNWEMNGEKGRSAYLQAMCVTQKVDRFAEQEGVH